MSYLDGRQRPTGSRAYVGVLLLCFAGNGNPLLESKQFTSSCCGWTNPFAGKPWLKPWFVGVSRAILLGSLRCISSHSSPFLAAEGVICRTPKPLSGCRKMRRAQPTRPSPRFLKGRRADERQGTPRMRFFFDLGLHVWVASTQNSNNPPKWFQHCIAVCHKSGFSPRHRRRSFRVQSHTSARGSGEDGDAAFGRASPSLFGGGGPRLWFASGRIWLPVCASLRKNIGTGTGKAGPLARCR